jgi:preprotein translocase subunit YajC
MSLSTALVLAAAAPAAGAAGGITDILQSPLLFIGVMVVLMYFLLLRPQQQRQKQHQQMIGGIKRGDTVVLSSGVIGKVVRVEDAELGIEVAQNVTIKVIKAMVSEVRTRGEPVAANDAKKS